MVSRTLTLNTSDNIAIALLDLQLGDFCERSKLTIQQTIPTGHKLATQQLTKGQPIVKYGHVIGVASQDIRAGEHVHTHNLHCSQDGFSQIKYEHKPSPTNTLESHTFNGYHRSSGSIGTRNYLGVLTTVNCSGTVAKQIAAHFLKSGALDAYDNIDGVIPITHQSGCGLACDSEGFEVLKRTLTGYAQHPNFGGILVVGLGCEVFQLSNFPSTKDHSVLSLNIQEVGGTLNAIKEGVSLLHRLANEAQKFIRQPAPASKLVLGMQCGGSDGFSGITANPALGVASDLLVAQGGTTILSETPEIFGAEHLLLQRTLNTSVANSLEQRIQWWESYCKRHGAELNNNPSPGNKQGGLTTILEKSLGAIAKSGRSPLSAVYQYAEKASQAGLVFMDSPGYDPCSVTGQIAAGATLIAFTTGRGSVSGFKPTPCLKLASTTDLYHRLNDDMDINCGDILSGIPIEQKGAEVFTSLIDIASGKQTKSEQLGFGDVEFVPWQLGAVL